MVYFGFPGSRTIEEISAIVGPKDLIYRNRKMMRSIAIATIAAVASATPFTTCDGNKMGIKTVAMSPENPAGGEPLLIEVDGNTSVDVSGGQATVVAKVLGITVATENFDICKDLGVTCPKAAGSDFSAHLSYPIPSVTPSGVHAKVQMKVTDNSGDELSCITMKIKTGKKGKSSFRAQSPREDIEFLFEAWKREFNQEFETAEEHMKRFAIFAANHVRIVEHNNSGASYTMAHNQFSHLTPEEFSAQYTGGFNATLAEERDASEYSLADLPATTEDVPAELDWTLLGAVTHVKDQGQCGSCWAFSATGALEGHYFIKSGKRISMSEQELVDCDSESHGCNGGLPEFGFKFAGDNGLAAETAYTYDAAAGTCSVHDYAPVLPAGVVTRTQFVPAGDEDALKTSVAVGPVSVAIEADQQVFQFYSEGVITGRCGRNLDHAVLVMGYGHQPAAGIMHPFGTDYWTVKNSWGNRWGEGGYMRIQRGVAKCGIADHASYPIMD